MSFWTAPTLASLTGGGAGSVIAVGGALLIARLSIRHERRRDADVRIERMAADDRALRLNAASAMVGVQRALLTEVRLFPFARGKTVFALPTLPSTGLNWFRGRRL